MAARWDSDGTIGFSPCTAGKVSVLRELATSFQRAMRRAHAKHHASAMPSSRWTPIIAVVALFGAHDTALAQGVARAGDLTLRVDGKPATIKRATLDSMPQKTIRLGAGPDSGEVSGVDLWQVLQYARAVSDQASGRQRAVMYLRVTGSDN